MAEPFGDPSAYGADGKAEYSALDNYVHVWFWAHVKALEPEWTGLGPMRALIPLILNATPVARKEHQKLLNLGRYGDTPSPKAGSQRWNGNRQSAHGCEVDYDGGVVPLSQAMAIFECLGIACIGYETAGATDTYHKWRLLFPFGAEYPIAYRELFVAAVDGFLGGIIAPESYTLSQPFFYGRLIDGRVPDVQWVEGGAIDQYPGIEAIGRARLAQRKAERKYPPPGPEDAGITVSKENQAEMLRHAFAGVSRLQLHFKRNGVLRTMTFVGGFAAHLSHYHREDIIEMCLAELAKCEPPPEDMEAARAAAEAGFEHGQSMPLSITKILADMNIGIDAARAGFEHVDDGKNPPPPPPPKPDGTTFYDPWKETEPHPMPSGIFCPEMSDTIDALAVRDGICRGVLGMAFLAAACCAIDKNCRFLPFRVLGYGLPTDQRMVVPNFDTDDEASIWAVPPVVWIMILAISGKRKTRPGELAFEALRVIQRAAWAKYYKEKAAYDRENSHQKAFLLLPEQPVSLLLNDCTPEAILRAQALSNKGAFYYADELARIYAFGRYGSGQGAGAERTFILETYEGSDYGAARISEQRRTECNAMGLYGCIQPARLAGFKDLADDGMIQRTNMIRPSPVGPAQPELRVAGIRALNDRVRGLLNHAPMNYVCTEDGAEIIKACMAYGDTLQEMKHYGQGWEGFAGKLHGTLARYCTLLHSLEDPTNPIIPTELIERADQLVRQYVLKQAFEFYSKGAHTVHQKAKNVSSWLLRTNHTRINNTLTRDCVRSVENLELRELADIMALIVQWAHLIPATPHNPSAWTVHPGFRAHFAQQREEQILEWQKFQRLESELR